MSQNPKALAVLRSKMNTNAVGKYQWQEPLNGWYLEMDANWDTRYIELLIKAHNSGLFQDFGRFSISRALLLSVILRYDNFNIRGKASVLSDELLRNPKSLSLPQINYPCKTQ